jgi:hypothetical protein
LNRQNRRLAENSGPSFRVNINSHASVGSTDLYDRRSDTVALDEVERIGIYGSG